MQWHLPSLAATRVSSRQLKPICPSHGAPGQRKHQTRDSAEDHADPQERTGQAAKIRSAQLETGRPKLVVVMLLGRSRMTQTSRAEFMVLHATRPGPTT